MAKQPTTFGTSYSAVEAALVRCYAIPRKAQGAFRGRLGNLQKQGLLGAKNMPGKGKALRYQHDQFCRLIFACELLEFGVSPGLVIALVKSYWDRRIRKIFDAADDTVPLDPGPHDVILFLVGVRLMGTALADAVPNINSCPLGKLPGNIELIMSMRPDDPAGLPPRVLATNLSMRLRAFHTALANGSPGRSD